MRGRLRLRGQEGEGDFENLSTKAFGECLLSILGKHSIG